MTCTEWEGTRDSAGYGITRTGGRAHRLAWITANESEIPIGMVVRHTCDNPPCVNPEHLILGTEADNVRDMIDRGRAHWQKPNKRRKRRALEQSEMGTRLIEDMRNVFRERDRMFTMDILTSLPEQWQWMGPRELAHILAGYEIRPKTIRIGNQVLKGYTREMLE